MIKVAIDAMGGDYAPQAIVDGAITAAVDHNLHLILVGQKELIYKEMERYPSNNLPISVQDASQNIGMKELPSVVFKKKRNSSICVALDLVRQGEAHALVSAGNSGAILAASMLILKRLKGVDRPAIATLLPTKRGASLLLDAGSNVDCKPFHLIQFAIMGSSYAKFALGRELPTVGLLSNGQEDTKGNELTRECNSILKESSLNYVGYLEGRDIYQGSADVIVCDGFVGNVVLKISEGLAETLIHLLEEEIKKGLFSRIGFFLSRKAFKKLKKMSDYSEYGGAPLLGIDGIAIVSHGSSSPKAIKNAILVAKELVERNLNQLLIEDLEKSQEIQSLGRKRPFRLLGRMLHH